MPATATAPATQLTLELFELVAHVDVEVPDTPAELTVDRASLWQADLGSFDGPGGLYRGMRTRREIAGVAFDADLDVYARTLLGDGLTVRTRRLLHRQAVLSVLVSAQNYERLRAATRWFNVIAVAAAEQHPEATCRRELPAATLAEVQYAAEGVFTIGAARLAYANAYKFDQPGTCTESDDLRQIAQEETLAKLPDYDHRKGKVSSYINNRVRDGVSEYVRREEYPGMPRRAFKNRGRIKALAEQFRATQADAGGHPLDVDTLAELIVAELDDVTVAGVRRVLTFRGDLSLNAPVTHDEGGTEFGDYLGSGLGAADEDSPEGQIAYRETLEVIGAALATQFNDLERDIVVRFFGLGEGPAETLRTIGDDYDRSCAWVGVQLKRALDKLKHPQIAGAFASFDTAPDDLSDEPCDPGVQQGWLAGLTERQRFVAGAVLGFGAAPLPGDLAQRRARAGELLDAAGWVIDRLIVQVVAIRDGRDVPPLYHRWYEDLTERQQIAARMVLRYGAAPDRRPVEARLADAAEELQVSVAAVRQLASVAAAAARAATGDAPAAEVARLRAPVPAAVAA